MGATTSHEAGCPPPRAQTHRGGSPSDPTGSAEAGISGAAFMLPMIAGGVLAAHNPKLAMGAGGLTVFVAATYKKDWRWWVVGILLLALGVFFQLNKKNENK
jgi:hypothetical protein